MSNITIKNRDADISVVTVELMNRGKINMKFKTRLYNEGYNGIMQYFHMEYKFKSKRSDNDVSVNISTNGFIQLTLKDEEKNKENIMITEVYRNKLIRKIGDIYQMVEAHFDEVIDLVYSDHNGNSSISTKYGQTYTKFNIGKTNLAFDIIVRSDINEVGVTVTLNDSLSINLSMYDFLDFIYKIGKIDFSAMMMHSLNYVRRPDKGIYEKDLRVTYNGDIDDKQDVVGEKFPTISSTGPTINGLELIPNKPLINNKKGW